MDTRKKHMFPESLGTSWMLSPTMQNCGKFEGLGWGSAIRKISSDWKIGESEPQKDPNMSKWSIYSTGVTILGNLL